ncbi:MAG: hypothetical protein WCO48_02905 [Candidatus Taylorbacteria bacterium]
MPQTVWCNYVCQKNGEGIVIFQSGLRDGVPILNSTLNGIEFPGTGEDATLWLIRNGQTIAICSRVGGQILPVEQDEVLWDVKAGVYMVENHSYGLLENDGFEITKNHIKPVPGQRPATMLRE